ncbi:MAG: hypothetical protein J3Q66DRAFT_330537 [Benniella sp.]|nr:MAG: hypothetical protein J3Q66DRAFT_330537 [Benniella sp.]
MMISLMGLPPCRLVVLTIPSLVLVLSSPSFSLDPSFQLCTHQGAAQDLAQNLNLVSRCPVNSLIPILGAGQGLTLVYWAEHPGGRSCLLCGLAGAVCQLRGEDRTDAQVFVLLPGSLRGFYLVSYRCRFMRNMEPGRLSVRQRRADLVSSPCFREQAQQDEDTR